MEAVLKAIAEPCRQEIIRLVWHEERTAGDVAAHFDLSRPNISKHLRILKEAGLIEERRQGTRRLYRARPERLADARRFLETFWDEGLAAIKRSAEDDARRRRARMTADPDAIVREIRIAATPEDVFPYFTDANKLVVWKAVSAELDARPGGTFRMDVTGRGDVAQGEYLEIDPPRRIVFTWRWETDDPAMRAGSSVIEVTLWPEGDETLLRFVQRGVPEQRRHHSSAGWAHYLERLALAAAGQDPGPDPWAGPAPAR